MRSTKPYFAIVFILVLGTTLICGDFSYSQGSSSNLESLWTRSGGEDWPRMLGPRYDSTSVEKGIRTDWGDKGLRIVWTKKTGVGYGNGVAENGRWFQFDRFGNKERLTCYHAENGSELWAWEEAVEYFDPYGYNNGPRCSPVVDGDRVYVYGVAGRLACISVVDGTTVWQKKVNQVFHVVPNFFGVGASPLVYGDLLWVMVGGSPAQKDEPTIRDLPAAIPDGSAMVAFDKRTGKVVHKVGNYLASYAAPVIRNINGEDVCLALVREGLLTFSPKDGSNSHFTPWRASILESVNAAPPVIIGNHVLAAEAYEIGGMLIEVSATGHKQLWRDEKIRKNQAVRPHWANPIVVGQNVFVSSGRNQPDTDLRCVSFAPKSKTSWGSRLEWSKNNRNRMTGIAIENYALMLGETGILQLIPAVSEAFSVKAEMELGEMIDPVDNEPYISNPSWAPPVIAHGLLYLRGANKILCLELIPQ